MMNLTAADIVSATRGTLLAGASGTVVRDITIDSRTAGAESLFVPLRGTTHDGHNFISSAFEQGAAAALTERAQSDTVHIQRFPGRSLIAVDCALQALGDLAAWWRRRFGLQVIAVTGSNGKTTTKEMIWSILQRTRACLKNEGNFNNLIGLPLTLFRLSGEHSAAVLEMGMSEPGEISRLAEISAPQIGVITNIGPCHLEQLKTLDAVAAAKGELFAALSNEAVAVINYDDERVRTLDALTRARTITFGLSSGNIRADNVRADSRFGTSFDLQIGSARAPVTLSLPGVHFVSDALAAAAAAYAAGVGLDDIRDGLCAFSGVPGRMQTLEMDGVSIINDAYNANPTSMRASLSALCTIPAVRCKIAVLGDMLELGEDAGRYHQDIGTFAAGLPIDRLFVVGSFAHRVIDGAVGAGMDSKHTHYCSSLESLVAELKATIGRGDAVLLKGSRKMQLEKVLGLLSLSASAPVQQKPMHGENRL